jgi:hypothetical protein
MMHSKTGNKRRGLVLQARDRKLLQELALTRVIDREQAKIIAGFGSTTRANARLLALSRAGLLRRFFLGATAGARKSLYALSRKGAELAEVQYRGPRLRNDEVLVANSFVQHQLALNQIYCALKTTGAPIPGPMFERWMTFYEPLTTHLRLIPDGYSELKTPSGVFAFFLELDLGHEGMKVWKEKVRNYLHLAISGDFERRFAQNRFHVLVIVNSERRLTWIRKAVRASTEKIFWFTTIETFHTKGLFAPIWFRPKGDDRHSLLSPPT